MSPQPTDEELVEHIAGHLCEEQPETLAGLSDAEINRRVRRGLARARSHGFTDPEPATAFVALMFLVSPCFDQHPSIAAAIRSASGTPAERLRTLFSRTSEQDWEQAASLGSWEEAG
ncbi:MAG: hypothetical protein ABSC08_06240 [Bryobacteraceae bacterium]|jgi:hypothetical protein